MLHRVEQDLAECRAHLLPFRARQVGDFLHELQLPIGSSSGWSIDPIASQADSPVVISSWRYQYYLRNDESNTT
jgi:hypothetical protein